MASESIAEASEKLDQGEKFQVDNSYIQGLRLGEGFTNLQQQAGLGTASAKTVYNQPVIQPNVALELVLNSNCLEPCINAYVDNIETTGMDLVPCCELVNTHDRAQLEALQSSQEAKQEKQRLESLMASVNEKHNLLELRRRFRYDYELFGYATIELKRDTQGFTIAAHHVPAQCISIHGIIRDVPVMVDLDVGNKKERIVEKVRDFLIFKYQEQTQMGEPTYFVEVGCPKAVDKHTGNVLSETLNDEDLNKDLNNRTLTRSERTRRLVRDLTDSPQSPNTQATNIRESGRLLAEKSTKATELLFITRYHPASAFGLPRWYTQLLSVVSSRKAELVNAESLSDNMMPYLFMLLSGGAVSQAEIKRIEGKLRQRGKDRTNFRAPFIMNVDGSQSAGLGADQAPVIPKVAFHEVKPYNNDLMFKELDERCRKNVRQAFRLPRIFVGDTDDYNRATSEASIQICEAQVFDPERTFTDDLFTLHVLGDSKNRPKYWEIKSRPTPLLPRVDRMKSIKTYAELGALSLNDLLTLAKEELELESIQPVEGVFGALPVSVLAKLDPKMYLELATKYSGMFKALGFEFELEDGEDEDSEETAQANAQQNAQVQTVAPSDVDD